MKRNINRRSFLKSTAATSASLALFPATLTGEEEEKSLPEINEVDHKVAEVHAPGVMIDGKDPDDPRVNEMVDKGMLALTGKSDLAEAWRCFVKPDDVVGFKVNSAGGKVMVSHKGILEAAIRGVRLAGVPAKNIIIWDQVTEYLERFYFASQKIDAKELEVGFEGCTPKIKKENYMEGIPLPGFETEPIKFPWGEVKVAELVANKLTAIINLPILKDHSCAGVTLALKNISHAVVDVPWLCHDDSCDPMIADICNIPSVRSKLRLHIMDCLLGMADGGPPFRSFDNLFLKEKILLSADPVAVDAIGHKWIATAREEMGYPLLAEADNAIPTTVGRPAKHIATAAKMGLGTDNFEKMEIVKVDLPIPEKEEKKEAEAG